ncbi:hypothetical protein H5410_028113 [Solanum commersonii]|uniref:Uncharacterized protein n=1 Tax=Solanum commersonii TaxID=4109 RepID=A0A9J5Z345_SOLCO|nr:hypothetical protein H5410_028113 [Solanum commersonii]
MHSSSSRINQFKDLCNACKLPFRKVLKHLLIHIENQLLCNLIVIILILNLNLMIVIEMKIWCKSLVKCIYQNLDIKPEEKPDLVTCQNSIKLLAKEMYDKYCSLDNVENPQMSMPRVGAHGRVKHKLGLDSSNKCEFPLDVVVTMAWNFKIVNEPYQDQ